MDAQALVRHHSRLVSSLETEALVDAGMALDSRHPRLQQTSLGALICTAVRRECDAEVSHAAPADTSLTRH